MKLDAFDQYIHDQYQGYEVKPPAAMEQAVMGRLNRAKWARRLGSGAALVALLAAGYWGFAPTSPSIPSTLEVPVQPHSDQPNQPAPAAGSISDLESTAEVAPVLEITEGARTEVETAPTQPVASTPRPGTLEPIKNRVEPAPLNGATAEGPALQQNAGGSELWIISAEVEVKD